jgi:protein tyrosine phosphatase
MSDWKRRTAASLRDQLSVMGQRLVPSNRDGFDDEFDSLRALDYKVRCNHDEFFTASLGSNTGKNRFRDVLPNEGTRVVLDAVNKRGDGDYINANYVDARRLFSVPFVYIATQAPMRSTAFDFWRMVFENNSVFIVMLCGEVEAGKIKSERYWPNDIGDTLNFGPLTVRLDTENVRNDTVFRTLTLSAAGGSERTVTHLQYIRWPDQGIPQNSSGLMEIIHYLGRAELSTQTPIVAHCSGGIGRTGVFMTLHIALALFQMEQPVSVPRIVQLLKYCRSGTVQRKDQYLFCYYVILREMERMVWAIETRRHGTKPERSYAGSGVTPGGMPERRGIEHRPQHPAQQPPSMVRSSLHYGHGDEEGYGREYVGGAPGIMGGYTTGASVHNSPTRGHGIRTDGHTASAVPSYSPAEGEDVAATLRELQVANKSARMLPSAHGSRGSLPPDAASRGFANASYNPGAYSNYQGAAPSTYGSPQAKSYDAAPISPRPTPFSLASQVGAASNSRDDDVTMGGASPIDALQYGSPTASRAAGSPRTGFSPLGKTAFTPATTNDYTVSQPQAHSQSQALPQQSALSAFAAQQHESRQSQQPASQAPSAMSPQHYSPAASAASPATQMSEPTPRPLPPSMRPAESSHPSAAGSDLRSATADFDSMFTGKKGDRSLL